MRTVEERKIHQCILTLQTSTSSLKNWDALFGHVLLGNITYTTQSSYLCRSQKPLGRLGLELGLW